MLLCVSIGVARADNTADESDIAFSQGNQAYAKRDYEKALGAYFLSYRLVPNRNVLFNIARCFEALDRPDEAYRYWYDISVDPLLPASDTKEVKQQLARLAPQVALISIETTPPNAELYVDREDLGGRGKTPQTIAVSPGPHKVLMKLPGYRTATVQVRAAKGRDVRQTVKLEAVVGTVEITGQPEGAIIRDGTTELGKIPGKFNVAPGQKLFSVEKQGYLSAQVLIDVRADETVTSTVNLAEKPKPTGKVILTANRDNALVRVDGKDSGFTPVVLTLRVGEHLIEISSPEVEDFRQKVNIAADSETRLVADLRYAPPEVQAASKSKLSIDQAPASVTVITREEIQAFGYQTLAQALTAVRGLFFTNDRIYTYVGVRGFSPPGDLNTRILFLYDGHPTNDIWAGQGFAGHDFDVDLSEVERIEVVRGPASILFGSGAVFGVINVVPRSRLPNAHNIEGVVGTGALNAVKARATAGLNDDELALLVSGAALYTNGADTTDLSPRGVVLGSDGERAYNGSVRGKLGGFTLSARINQRVKQVPTAPLGSELGVAGTQYTDLRGFAEAKYEKSWDRFSLMARASYDASRYRGFFAFHDDSGAVVRNTDSGGADWLGAEIRGDLKVFEGNRLSLSLEAQGQFITQQFVGSTLTDPHTRTVLAGTLIDEWQIASWLFVQAGVRFDKYFDLQDIAIAPRGALVIKPYERGITKIAAGQAFRAPNIYELFYNDDNLTTRSALNLRPELITTVEIEHSHNFTPELRVTAGAYFNNIDRLVDFQEESLATPGCGTPDDPVQCFVYGNASASLRAFGGDAELRWQPGRFTMVNATYSFVYLQGATADAVPSYPTHLASLRALVPIKEGLVRLSGQATYQSARLDSTGNRTGESLLLNFGVSGEYSFLKYFAGVQNLLDARYTLPVSTETGFGTVPQYGRTFWIELSAGW